LFILHLCSCLKIDQLFSSMMQVKKLTDLAIIPVRGSAFAAGFDLSSAYNLVVPKKGKAIVKTDLAIAIPENTYARIGEEFAANAFLHHHQLIFFPSSPSSCCSQLPAAAIL
jgi:hypothetical protein